MANTTLATPRRRIKAQSVAAAPPLPVVPSQSEVSKRASCEYRRLRGEWDSAATTETNRYHWARADALSANASASPEARKVLRERARYECKNNSYGIGIVETLANDLVGTGARLQYLSKNPDLNRHIEWVWNEWAEETGYFEKLLTLRKSKAIDGEGFGIVGTDMLLDSPVKLNLALIEADQITTPTLDFTRNSPNQVDGVLLNTFGAPIEYHVLKYHPGDTGAFFNSAEFGKYDTVDARYMVHYFTPHRPRQARGIPDVTPAIELFAQLRRATLAVMRAFEIAACHAAVISTTNPQNESAKIEDDPFVGINFHPGMMTTLPEGWSMQQFKSEQPVSTYKMFKDEVLCEISRCLHVPFNVASGRSDGYNYASGRLDFQNYQKAIEVERRRLERSVLNRVFKHWLSEAVLVDPYIARRLKRIDTADWRWMFAGSKHVDPAKEAAACQQRLLSSTSNLAIECANEGLDWEDVLNQRSVEQKKCEQLGLPYSPAIQPNQPQDQTKKEEPDAEEA